MARRSRLAARRKAREWTQESLAHHLGVARNTVGRWEQGTSEPEPWNRRPLADALDVSLDRLDELLVEAQVEEQPVGDVAATIAALENAPAMLDDGTQNRPVLRLLGHAHHAAGDMAFDRLQLGEAAEHYSQAHELGLELGDADMTAVALTQLGDIARRRRRYRAALRLFDAAGDSATAAGVLVQVRQAQTLARAQAELGDRQSFDRSIGAAEQLAAWVSSDIHQDGDNSPRGVRLERAHGYTILGDPSAALAIYASETTTFRTERERGSFLIIRAQALAHAGHLDEGVRVAIEGLQLARSYRSDRHVSRVQRMHDRLVTVWPRTEPKLTELREALAG